ncbi:MAG TPA: hypothetical protein VHB20_16695 [Verrucomicrobiae bacterium]|jgi:hypothetical protein|nr:hypothetical protein [Verrucomicrobiae bacterium]
MNDHEMRARPWLLTSLGLNLFLAVSWWVAREPLEDTTVVIPAYRPETDIKTNVFVRRENFTWNQIESTNYDTLIKNLRTLGCPEQTIRDIIVTDVDREFDRRRATEIVAPDYQWWKSDPDPAIVQAAATQAQALEDERRRLLNSLLGPGWENISDYSVATRAGISLTGPVLGELSPSVKQNVLAIVAQEQAKMDSYLQNARQNNQPPDPMEVARMRDQFLGQLVTVLTPDQYEEFILRYSPGAQAVRQQMHGMNLGPDQFRALYNALAPAVSQPVYYYAGSDPELLKQQRVLQAAAEDATKTALGDQLYATYRLEQDPLYRSSQTLASQLGIPPERVRPLYQINRTTESELERIRVDPTLSADEKVEALAQTQVDQQQSLQQLLGPDLFDKWLAAQPLSAK